MVSCFNIGIAEMAVWHEDFHSTVDPSTMEFVGSGSDPSLDDGSLQCSLIEQCRLPDDVGLTEEGLV